MITHLSISPTTWKAKLMPLDANDSESVSPAPRPILGVLGWVVPWIGGVDAFPKDEGVLDFCCSSINIDVGARMLGSFPLTVLLGFR